MKEENNTLLVKKEDLRLSVKEAAEFIQEKPGVVRNWLRELKHIIPTIIGEHGYRYFDQKGIDMLQKVKVLRDVEQLSLRQIEQEFSSPVLSSVSISVEKTDQIVQDLKIIKEQLELQINFNSVLVKQLKKQQEHIERQYEFIQTQKEHITALLDRGSSETDSIYQVPMREKQEMEKKKNFFRFFSYR